MIRGYPHFPSLYPGETLILHVSCSSPFFRVAFYRQGERLQRISGATEQRLSGVRLPDGPPDLDWGWPSHGIDIPAEWPSGAYIAMLIEIAADGSELAPDPSTSFGTTAKALFVLRHRGAVAPGTFLYKISWTTFVAYNGTGYGSLYTEAVWSRTQPNPGFKVTWRRPGCGTGGEVMPGDAEDFYDPSSRRQTFEHWDAPLVSWLEREGYRPHYCTDWDLHHDPMLLDPYSLLLSVGHDEYWSDSMRAALGRHAGRGGNLAFFSGNISGYRIHFVDDDTAIACAKIGPASKDPEDWPRDVWHEVNPEARLLGVATAFGGGWWDGKRRTQGYKVQHASHWVFAGTGLAEGDEFGADEAFPLIGYEVDGAAYRRQGGRALATGEMGTPRDFVILGLAELGEGWVTGRANAAATMGMYTTPRGGSIFQGATTDWPILVPRNAQVAAITRNVIEHLRLPSARIIGPLPHRAGRMLSAVGEVVSFHADAATFGDGHEPRAQWQVAGVEIVEESGLLLRVRMPEQADFVTISVTLWRGGERLAFGTRTLLPLSAEEAAKLDLLINMREMVLAGEPSNPLVAPAYDPLDRSWLIFSIRVPWLRERAARIERAAARLLAMRRRPEG